MSRDYDFNITIVDVVFGILIGLLLDRYSDVATLLHRCHFFFALIVTINYYYSYRRWVERIGDPRKETVLLDVFGDLGILFVCFQFVRAFNSPASSIFYIWFAFIYVADFAWLGQRMMSHRLHVKNQSLWRYWMLTDLLVAACLWAGILFLPDSGWLHLAVMVVAFCATFAIDPLIQSMMIKRANKGMQADG